MGIASAGRKVVIEFLGEDRSLSKAAAEAETRTSRLGKRLASVGKVAAFGLGAGVAIGAAALVDMTKGAIEDAAGQAKLKTALQNNAKATDQQVASVENWISAQGVALGVTDDDLRPALGRLVAATHDVGKAQKLASLAMDISAGSGQSLESVSKALAKAQNGSVAGLTKLGIKTKDAAGHTIDFEQAQKRLADTYKGAAAKHADTLQGKMQRLKLIFDETKESIGAKLIPVVTKLADWFLRKALPAIQAFGSWLGEHVPPIFTRIRDTVKRVLGEVDGNVGGTMGQIRETIQNAVTIFRILWARFGGFYVQYIKSTLHNVLKIVSGAFNVIAGIIKVFSSLLRGDWKGVWNGVKQILKGVLQIIVGTVKQFFNLLRFLFKVGASAIKGIFAGLWDGIKQLVSTGMGKIVDLIRGLPGRLLGLQVKFAQAGLGLIKAFVNGIKNAGGLISDVAGKVWDAVKSLLNQAIGKINAALDFTISLPLGKSLHIDAPDIPMLARGTKNHRGGWAVVGEAGPELVNLPRGSQVVPNRQSVGMLRGLGGGGGVTIVVQGAIDPISTARQIEQIMRTAGRSLGRGPVFVPNGG